MTPNAEYRPSKITPSLKGKLVVFDGYDGKRYTAFVESVRKGVAVIHYSAGYGHPSVIGYIDDASRFSWRP